MKDVIYCSFCGEPCGQLHHVGSEPDFAEGTGEDFSFSGKWHCSQACLDETIAKDTCPDCGLRGYDYQHACGVERGAIR
jgi:hypothetical protein